MVSQANISSWFFVVTGTTTIFALAAAYFFQKRKLISDVVPTEWRTVGKVSTLHLYPLKSGHRIDLNKGECTEFGFKASESDEKRYRLRDRSFVIYKEEDKEFRTAGTFPKIMLIELDVKDESQVTLKAPEMDTQDVKIPTNGAANQFMITLWKNEKVNVLDCGDDVARWISEYILDKPSGMRLAFHEGKNRRNLSVFGENFFKTYPKLSNADTGMLSNLSSFHLINQGSIDDLNGRLSQQVTANNFRPNILVTGPDAFAEDSWDWIKIGDVLFRNVKPCTRCMLTTIDPETAIRSKNREPLKTLESYRLPSEEHIAVNGKKPVMGINVGLKKSGEINVGDMVYVGIN